MQHAISTKLNLNSSRFFVLMSLMLTWWLFKSFCVAAPIFWDPIVFVWIKRQSSSTQFFVAACRNHTSLYRTWWIYVCKRVCDCWYPIHACWVSLTRISVRTKVPEKKHKTKKYQYIPYDCLIASNRMQQIKKSKEIKKKFSCRYVLSDMWWTMICILYAKNALNNNNKGELQKNLTEVPADYPKCLTKSFHTLPLFSTDCIVKRKYTNKNIY